MKSIKQFNVQTFSSLKIRNYRLYFIGQAVSLIGTWMQTIGQDWLVLKLTNSGTQLGIVSAFQFLPILLLGPWGGVIADRFPKLKILYMTQASCGILALILGILVATNAIQIWMIYVLALALGITTAVNNPVRQTFIFEMVGEKEITNAVTLNSALFNLTRAIGPVIAGVLIAGVGLAACFFINAISYIAVLIAFSRMRQAELNLSPLVEKAKGQLRQGFTYVKSIPLLRETLIIMAIIGTLSYEFSVSLPLLARFTFHGDAQTYAVLTASFGLGSVIGSFFVASRKIISASSLINSAWMFGVAILIAAIAPNLALAILALIFVGALSISLTSMGSSILQLNSAPQMRGRVMALWSVAILGSTPIGGPIIGFIGEHLNPRWGLGVGGVAAIIAAGIGMIALNKTIKSAPKTLY